VQIEVWDRRTEHMSEAFAALEKDAKAPQENSKQPARKPKTPALVPAK
jgi:hypothetical protein